MLEVIHKNKKGILSDAFLLFQFLTSVWVLWEQQTVCARAL
jgi:hypothetical protein